MRCLSLLSDPRLCFHSAHTTPKPIQAERIAGPSPKHHRIRITRVLPRWATLSRWNSDSDLVNMCWSFSVYSCVPRYLLVFLPRATVGLVSRAFASGGAKVPSEFPCKLETHPPTLQNRTHKPHAGPTLGPMQPRSQAAQPELQRALSVAMPVGIALSVVYMTSTAGRENVQGSSQFQKGYGLRLLLWWICLHFFVLKP